MKFNMKYIIVEWPYSQELMEFPDFKEHACLINDDSWIDIYGSSAFFVEENWLNEKRNK